MVTLEIIYEGRKHVINAARGSNLLGILINNDFNISAPCGGEGKCGKCLVKFKKGIPDPGNIEKELISTKDLKLGYRLACKKKVDEGMVVRLTREEKMEIMTSGINLDIDVNPCLEKDMYNYANNKKLYGVAVDIGTTTIVLYLFNLFTGEEVDQYSLANPQKQFGADVISRINYTIKRKVNIKKMQKVLIKGLNQALNLLLDKNGLRKNEVYQFAITGNTVMLHTLLGISAESIAKFPYTPEFSEEVTISPYEIDLDINSRGEVSLMPSISGYVGADIVADMLVLDKIRESNDWNLLIDIGTNGEMVLDNGQKSYACSTAAGPALEGANIKHGMAGIEGAISSFRVDEQGEKVIETINGKEAKGICGSGLIDIVAYLLKNDLLNKDGSMVLEKEEIIECEGQTAFLVTAKSNEKIILTQKDIREIQLAKGAIEAGINILLKEAELNYSQISNLYLAGGFGNYIDPKNASSINLVPVELENKIIQMGNGAGIGAGMYLLNKKMRKKAIQIKSRTNYIELSTRKDFQEGFMKAMYF